MSDATRLLAYIGALDAHDWDFEFSDDPTTWHRGRASLRALEADAKEVDPDFSIWDDRCPLTHRRNSCPKDSPPSSTQAGGNLSLEL